MVIFSWLPPSKGPNLHQYTSRRTHLWLSLGGANLAWAVAALTGCSASVEPGVSVDVVAARSSLEAETVLDNDLGYEVRLEGAWVTNSEFEIEPCEGPLAKVWNALVPSAHAHGIESPTRLAEPVVQALLSGKEVLVGQLLPPVGEYCALRYQVGPADADAVGLEDAPRLEGRSLLLLGSYRLPGAEWSAFEISSQASFELQPSGVLFSLSANQRSARIEIREDPREWLTGLDFAASSEQELSQLLLGNVRASISINVD